MLCQRTTPLELTNEGNIILFVFSEAVYCNLVKLETSCTVMLPPTVSVLWLCATSDATTLSLSLTRTILFVFYWMEHWDDSKTSNWSQSNWKEQKWDKLWTWVREEIWKNREVKAWVLNGNLVVCNFGMHRFDSSGLNSYWVYYTQFILALTCGGYPK